jgi:acrylyl-CoA reductase (NADPH) / 3-hydroxypropionyl-CoA dehydratase / 3-hydroxypropionyl-CoA synthetase
MFADFSIQGYETKTGSHAQFLTVQAPQLHTVPGDLTLEQAGSYILNLGTIVRCLFTTLQIVGGKTIFIEGSATGTGLDALKSSKASGLNVTGLVSSPARAEFVKTKGAVGRARSHRSALCGAVHRRARWRRGVARPGKQPAPLVAEYKRSTAASWRIMPSATPAKPRSRARSSCWLKAASWRSTGRRRAITSASWASPAASTAEAMLQKAGARGGEAVLIFYGPNSTALADETGLEMIEAARGSARARWSSPTPTASASSSCRWALKTRWPGSSVSKASSGGKAPISIGRTPCRACRWRARTSRAFREAVREFQDKTLKPFGNAVGKLLRSPDNPRGNPDIVLERAGQDTLGVTTALVKPFTGRVVYAEDMAGQRYNFYAPQVWTRQRRIMMPTAEILGTHLCNAYEVTRMNDMVAAGLLDVTEPTVVPWEGLPEAHQSDVGQPPHRRDLYRQPRAAGDGPARQG